MNVLSRLLILAAVLTVAGIGTSGAALASGACPTLDDGVTVVVDFRGLGAGVHVRCAPGDPASGFAALRGAGFSYEEVAAWPGVLCRIDGLPGTDREDCQDMPPGDAYWAYFHAERGGSWSYSSTGAGRYDPAVGSVEGWSFSEGGGAQQPRQDPPPPPEPEPEPEPSPSIAPQPDPEPTSDSNEDTVVAGAQDDAPDAEPAEPTPTAAPRAPSPALVPDAILGPADASPSPSPSPSLSPSEVPPQETAAAPLREPPRGSPWPTVVAGGLVGILLLSALIVRRRRAPR
ncbi:MAG: hypothetical protein R3320_05565 [Nitriliruptorales bacterium]|nr:hypothetical protein [Nitriliruptorales bacterium]